VHFSVKIVQDRQECIRSVEASSAEDAIRKISTLGPRRRAGRFVFLTEREAVAMYSTSRRRDWLSRDHLRRNGDRAASCDDET
jgi:hypothetical protein